MIVQISKDQGVIVRDEKPSDREAISLTTQEAFKGHPYSRQTEARIVDALRDAGALAISLVAEFGGKVVGHIAFSRVSISDGTRDWYGIGPLSVLPGFQGRGLGSALVRSGLDRLRRIGGKGCVLVGEPQYYERFGFKSDPNLTHEDIPAEYFMALSLEPQSKNDAPAGIVTFHEGFDVK